MKNIDSAEAVKEREDMYQAEIMRLDAENADKDRIIADLQKSNPTPSLKPTIPEETFVVEDVEYKFLVAGFYHKNKFYTSKQALELPEVLTEIVEFGIVTTV